MEEISQDLIVLEESNATDIIPVTVTEQPEESNDIALKKKKQNKKSSKKSKEQACAEKITDSASGRSIDSMYRNAYRTQVDLIRIADNKANIMISINGLIISIGIAGAGMAHSLSSWLLSFSICFLLSCLCSLYFAVLAARPKVRKNKNTVEDFANGSANVLFFYDQASVSQDEYVKIVETLQEKNEYLYHQMSRHIHSLGLIIFDKYHLLRISYNFFIYGFITSLVALIFMLLEVV